MVKVGEPAGIGKSGKGFETKGDAVSQHPALPYLRNAEKGKIVIKGSSIQDGMIVLEQVEKNPNPGLLEIANKVREFRTLYAEYIR